MSPTVPPISQIMKSTSDAALIFKSGGGVGINYSDLREEGDIVASTSGVASGPVSFNHQSTFFNQIQTLEFLSLIASGAAAIGLNKPIFCNGANMAYRKADFLELNNFENDEAVSGDDVFLLHSVKEKYKDAIAFAKDENATVLTDAVQTAKGFINQRKRWTAKTSGYKDFASIYSSFLVLFTNLSLVFLFVGYLYSDTYFHLFLLIL